MEGECMYCGKNVCIDPGVYHECTHNPFFVKTKSHQKVATESFLDRAKREEANKVSNPSHYQGGIQPLEFFLANPQLNFIQCNIIKYVFRYKNKGGLEDLKKAQFYLNLLIENETTNQ